MSSENLVTVLTPVPAAELQHQRRFIIFSRRTDSKLGIVVWRPVNEVPSSRERLFLPSHSPAPGVARCPITESIAGINQQLDIVMVNPLLLGDCPDDPYITFCYAADFSGRFKVKAQREFVQKQRELVLVPIDEKMFDRLSERNKLMLISALKELAKSGRYDKEPASLSKLLGYPLTKSRARPKAKA